MCQTKMAKNKTHLRQHKKGAKGKRWKKGQSSGSNPSTKQFRDSAKQGYFNINRDASGLTEDALADHNKGDDVANMDLDTISQSDKESVTAKTFSTWATNWTECTNATFNPVYRLWKSNSAFHREILAVLAAVTEVIKTQGGKETETEYFASLVTALDTAEAPQTLSAMAYLLSLAIKRTPVAVLQSRFSVVAKKLLDLLGKNADLDSTSLLKSLLLCLAALLRAQEVALWSHSTVQQVYSGLLTFVTHSKPKVRKTAHQGVKVVLKGSFFMTESSPPLHHPAAAMTAKYCIQQIEQCGGSGEALATLHTLGLLRDIMAGFPLNSLKMMCETILRVMTLSNVMVTSCCLQALHGMFIAQPSEANLSADLNAQIITALYEYQPAESDSQLSPAWLSVMEQAHLNLSRLDGIRCVPHLPHFVGICMTCLQSHRAEVIKPAAAILKEIMKQCLSSVSEHLQSLVDAASLGSLTPVHKILNHLEAGLGYQFHSTWGFVLEIFAAYFEAIGKQCCKIMDKSLHLMAGLRETFKFGYKAELDVAVGSAVASMGPQRVLEVIPLNITGVDDDLEFPRSWLIPIIRDKTMDTELGFFINYFLPLAAKLKQRSDECKAQNQTVEAKTYAVLQEQIWALLPGFCTRPVDLPQAFPNIAKVLGTAISDRDDLRLTVMASLRKLILHNQENAENCAVLSRFAKNYLPILFNIFTSNADKPRDMMRMASLETIKIYLKHTDKQLIATYLDKSFEKFKEGDCSACRRHALLDLLIAFLPYVDMDRLGVLYELATSKLEDSDRTMQKKSYRILEVLCSGQTDESRLFVKRKLEDLQKILLQSLSKSGPSSKAPRLRCLIHIFHQLATEQKDSLITVVPEAVLCTKEMNEKARLAAYTLLSEIGHAVVRWSSVPEQEQVVLYDYFKLVLAGLAGSPHTVSATLQALGHLLHVFKLTISNPLLDTLVESACLLLKSKTREIVQSALAFMKVILVSYPDVRLACYLQQIMSSIGSMKDDTRLRFRLKTKQILSRLIRKFSYETVRRMLPSSFQKFLSHTHKMQERAKRKKEKDEDEDDDMDDDEDARSTAPRMKAEPESIDELLRDTDSEPEDDARSSRSGKSSGKARKMHKGGRAWLQEGAEGDIVDFLDPAAAKKVLASRPDTFKTTRGKEREASFKRAPDGRLIITEPKDDQGLSGHMEEDADLDELFQAIDGGNSKRQSGKRKHPSADDVGDTFSAAKYRAGGSGIHRPLAKGKHESSRSSKSFEIGREYKAKKAAGDVKRKGKPDPYAYVPLDFQILNKRKQAKFKGRFNNLVRAAKQGAAKGKKAKGKQKKHN